MPFTIIRQDITKMKVDAIVNAANTALSTGGGVCGAIFKVAGEDKLRTACEHIGRIQTGEAVVTPGFNLPSMFIIHTAGPVYVDGKQGEDRLLYSCYKNSLERAVENQCESIAFPLISSGIYGYPKADALQVATSCIQEFLMEHELDIYLAVFDKESFTVSGNLLGAVESYIDEYYVKERSFKRRSQMDDVEEAKKVADFAALPIMAAPKAVPKAVPPLTHANVVIPKVDLLEESISVFSEDSMPSFIEDSGFAPTTGLEGLIGRLDESFATTLLRLIDAKGKTDVWVYKRANIDRKLFSKIRTGKGYMPGKRTAVALAIALELSLDETTDLLTRAGYALSHSQMFDVIIEYFIVNREYDIYKINEVLFQYDQPLLGG